MASFCNDDSALLRRHGRCVMYIYTTWNSCGGVLNSREFVMLCLLCKLSFLCEILDPLTTPSELNPFVLL